jgi:hypothetical protein
VAISIFGHIDQLQSQPYVRPWMDFHMSSINHFTDFVENIIFQHPAALRNFADKTQKMFTTVFRATTLLFSHEQQTVAHTGSPQNNTRKPRPENT